MDLNSTISILSFNPDTDFELMMYDSAIESAIDEYNSLYSNDNMFDSCLESLFSILDDNIAMEEAEADENKENDNAEKEAKKANIFKKISASWEAFKAKCVEFFNKISTLIKNVMVKIQAKNMSKNIKNGNAYALSTAKVNFLDSLPTVEQHLLKISKMTNIVSKYTSEYDSEVNKTLEKLSNLKNAVEEDKRKRLLNQDRRISAVDGSRIKSWLSNIVKIIDIGKKNIKSTDTFIKDIKRTNDTSDYISDLNARKKMITESINFARISMSYISESISASRKREKELTKSTEPNAIV